MTFFDYFIFYIFIIDGVVMVVSGFTSFIYNYQKALLFKRKLQRGEIISKTNIKAEIQGKNGLNKLLLKDILREEFKRWIPKDQDLKGLHSKYVFYLKIQIFALIFGFLIFGLFIAIKILLSWHERGLI